jgi:hypothetical protein
MFRWKTSGVLVFFSLAFGIASPVFAQAASPLASPHSASASPHYPTHHPHVGTVEGVHDGQLTVDYPADSLIPEVQVALKGAYLRAGFYPVASLPLAAGQHVLVLGTKSAHPTIMLLPEARGVLGRAKAQWTLTTHQATVALSMSQPTLLGGAALEPGSKVDVFGTRSGSTVNVAIVAGTPHILRAMVTTVQNNQIQLRSETGGTLAYPIANLPPDWSQHLSQLKPTTPVLAVVSPQGKVLGVLPMRALWRHHHEAPKPAETPPTP